METINEYEPHMNWGNHDYQIISGGGGGSNQQQELNAFIKCCT